MKFDKIIENILQTFDESELYFEMANLKKDKTRLPVNIWVDEIGSGRNLKHYIPRIKFQSTKSDKAQSGIPISISKKPEILVDNYETDLNNYEIGQVKNFIIRNYDLLMKHWNQEITTEELINQIKKV